MMSSSSEPEKTVETLQKTRRSAIAIFIILAVVFGIFLITLGTLLVKQSPYDVIFATVGSTLIAVGIVDVVAETFIRPGTTDLMKQCFPLFANPKNAPKDALKQQLVNIISHLSPKPEHEEDFASFFKVAIVEQLKNLSKEDFDVSLKLEKAKLGDALPLLTKVSCEWKYDVHNNANNDEQYEIPFYCNTFSYTNMKIPLKDHIGVEQVIATHGMGSTEDVGERYGLYKQQPTSYDGKVQLQPKNPLLVKLLPNETLSVYIKYHYIGELCDRHTQRMSMLTYKTSLNIEFDPKDFIVVVDAFCLPKQTPVSKHHKYDWNGWLLPNHGFIVEWKPILSSQRSLEKEQ